MNKENNAIELKNDNAVSVSPDIVKTAAVAPTEMSVSQSDKDAQFLAAHKALTRLMKLRKTKHRNKNAGAFGGVGVLRKKKKKFARYLERNTIL